MPTYTYECKKCRKSKDIVKPMREATKEERCNCGSLLVRCYQLAQVVRDTRGHDLVLDAYAPLSGKGGPDKVSSRTELKTWIRKYNDKNGTGLTLEH